MSVSRVEFKQEMSLKITNSFNGCCYYFEIFKLSMNIEKVIPHMIIAHFAEN